MSNSYAKRIPLGTFGTLLKLFTRILQTVFGLSIAAVYANEVRIAQSHKGGYNHAWGFAVVVGVLTCLTAFLFCFRCIKAFSFFFVDGLYAILWAIVTGIFGGAYWGAVEAPKKGAPPTVGPDMKRMKATAWLDLIVLVLWVYTWVSSMVYWFRMKKDVKGGRSF